MWKGCHLNQQSVSEGKFQGYSLQHRFASLPFIHGHLNLIACLGRGLHAFLLVLVSGNLQIIFRTVYLILGVRHMYSIGYRDMPPRRISISIILVNEMVSIFTTWVTRMDVPFCEICTSLGITFCKLEQGMCLLAKWYNEQVFFKFEWQVPDQNLVKCPPCKHQSQNSSITICVLRLLNARATENQ